MNMQMLAVDRAQESKISRKSGFVLFRRTQLAPAQFARHGADEREFNAYVQVRRGSPEVRLMAAVELSPPTVAHDPRRVGVRGIGDQRIPPTS
jgi:glutamate mutase epsilon subunit